MSEPRGGAGRRRPTRRRPVSIVGVLGELLISAGVFVLLFLGWQLWFNDLVVGSQLHDESLEQSSTWQGNASTAENGTPTDPPVMDAPGSTGEVFGLMIIPRFGADYYRPIAQGTGTTAVLNKGEIGHYPTSSMPGAVGNFAVAAHRTSYGKPFNGLGTLRVGDHIFVETADGWYQYTFRNLEYVRPTGVGVIDPVPQSDGVAPTDRFLTMTSCNPMFTAAERIIAYSVYESFFPRADGPPDEIAATVAGGA
ncbi:MAG: class E sortase [Pseudolysinimonas sp.]